MIYFTRFILLILCVALTACSQPTNPPLEKYDYRQGYRFGNCSGGENADELFIALTFSGGGTRAAAFSYGVLKALHETEVTLIPRFQSTVKQGDCWMRLTSYHRYPEGVSQRPITDCTETGFLLILKTGF